MTNTRSSEALDGATRDYFIENSPPPTLEEHKALAQEFIQVHAASGKRLVLITSGGTTVPLEQQTVRFIDNFSAGTRGATSAEYFLEAGYAVIFLHRQFSLLPYSRHYSHTTNCFLDFIHEGPNGNVIANEGYREKMLEVLRKYHSVKKKNLLITIPYTTVTDYLFILRSISQLMRPLGSSGLLYLAAAVSDFFIPPERLPEHKIQSTSALDPVSNNKETLDNCNSPSNFSQSKRLVIDLDPVPKFLKNLVEEWASEGMIVSFKLETDPKILIQKAQYSLKRYQHHLVIGNLLASRKTEVVFVTPEQDHKWIRTQEATDSIPVGLDTSSIEDENDRCRQANQTSYETTERGSETEIESLIIPAVVELHTKYIERCSQ